MDNCWNELPTFEPTLEKKGLEPHEFESILLSKITKIFTHAEVPVDNSIKKTVVELKREICIRENRTKPGLDKRSRRAIQTSVDNEILPNADETPQHMMESTRRQRGVIRFDRKHMKKYHNKQHELFTNGKLLGSDFRNLLPPINLREDNKGFFFHDNGDKFKIEEACRVIDKFTCMFLRYLKNDQGPAEEWAPQKISEIRSCCRDILVLRWNVDWATSNDLLNIQSYTEWKKHVMIGISYAALVVVLDIKFKRQHPEAPVVNSWPGYWRVIRYIVKLFQFIVLFFVIYTLL